jgi:hypothetical protein
LFFILVSFPKNVFFGKETRKPPSWFSLFVAKKYVKTNQFRSQKLLVFWMLGKPKLEEKSIEKYM